MLKGGAHAPSFSYQIDNIYTQKQKTFHVEHILYEFK
jgi:hypothetical protein